VRGNYVAKRVLSSAVLIIGLEIHIAPVLTLTISVAQKAVVANVRLMISVLAGFKLVLRFAQY
jgi:hypothetical protein